MKKIITLGIVALLIAVCVLFYVGVLGILTKWVDVYKHNLCIEELQDINNIEDSAVNVSLPDESEDSISVSNYNDEPDTDIDDITEGDIVDGEIINDDVDMIVEDNNSREDSKGTDDENVNINEEGLKPEILAIDIPILIYHHILKDEENPNKNNPAIISLERFTDHINYLYDNGYRTITLNQISRFLDEKQGLPEKSIMITFDDGYKSNYIYAYPVLKKYKYNAVVFLITDYMTDEIIEFDPNKIQYLSWNEVNSSSDVFEFASHSHNMHRNPNGVGYLISKPNDEVKNDLIISMDLLNTNAIAYPFGQYNDGLLEVLKELKVDLGFTVDHGKVKAGDNRLLLKRIGIFSYTTLSKFKELLR